MNIDRRTLVAGGATLGLTAVAQSQPSPPTTPPPTSLIETKTLLQNSAWMINKKRLVSKYSWLAPFAVDLPVDTIVYNTTSSSVTAKPPYDPYQIETLAASTSSLLDRCLSYRQTLYSLDEQATKRALQYELYEKQSGVLQAIETAVYLQQKWTNENTGELATQAAFANDSTTPLAQGFTAAAKVRAASAATMAAGEQARAKNVSDKWAATNDYQATLQSRHDTPGNPLNYVERYNRVAAYLQEDVGIAFQKLRCLSAGCNAIFGLNLSLPPPSPVAYLDTMVTFLRNLMNQVEIATQTEVSFNHIVYLHQPKVGQNPIYPPSTPLTPLPNPKPVIGYYPRISTDDWQATLQAVMGNSQNHLRSFAIDLTKEFPSTITRLRVAGVGLTMTLGNPSATDATYPYKSASAIVFPPTVTDLLETSPTPLMRSPLIIEGIGLTSPTGPTMIAPSSVRNIDPRGVWFVQLSANFYQPDATTTGSPDQIDDLKLHISLVGSLEADPNKWSAFLM
jgi:hypothetical protein